MIGAMIYYDLTFDKFHPNADRIYRVTSEFNSPDGKFYNPGVPIPLGENIAEIIPEIEITAPIFTAYPSDIFNPQTALKIKSPKFVIYADNGYFELFKYKWLAGSSDDILTRPNEVVLSSNRAQKYFGNKAFADIIGSTLIYNDTIPVKVTGIVENFKNRSDLVFEEFISLKTTDQSDMTGMLANSSWDNTNSASQLFVQIKSKTTNANVSLELEKIAKEHEDPESVAFGQTQTFRLQALNDIHFNRNYYTFDFAEGMADLSVLKNLGFIALFLLLLGCINFINLNTAQATKRAKEIGIRKTLGSTRKQLINQFFLETFLLTFLAAILSVFLSFWLLNIFSDYTPKGITIELFTNPLVISAMIFLVGLVTVLAGFYPALILSNFRPVAVLNKQKNQHGDNSSLRKYLTVFQFTIAQVFIIATILVTKQINYLGSKDMGFKSEAIASVRTPWQDPSVENRIRLLNQIKAIPNIEQVSLSRNPPASNSTNSTHATYLTEDGEINTPLQLLKGDANFLNLYGIELLAGRQQINDSIREYIINETYLKRLGLKFPIDAIGKQIKTGSDSYEIVGVMKDFHQRSLKMPISPLAFVREKRDNFRTIHFSILINQEGKWTKPISEIEKLWKDIYPDYDFNIDFMDDTIQLFYKQERKMSVLLYWATALSIIISCLGLFGLVIHTTEKRTKEIGIRKVLGASLPELNVLLCNEFLRLVLIAFVIAIPIAWYGLNQWLADFSNKTNLSWWVFLLSGFVMILVSILIMSIKTMTAANRNPVESLRNE